MLIFPIKGFPHLNDEHGASSASPHSAEKAVARRRAIYCKIKNYSIADQIAILAGVSSRRGYDKILVWKL